MDPPYQPWETRACIGFQIHAKAGLGLTGLSSTLTDGEILWVPVEPETGPYGFSFKKSC